MDKRFSKKYRNDHEDLLNEFRDERIEKVSYCKRYTLLYAFFTLINTGYFLTTLYIYNNISKYTDNNILKDPLSANTFFNNINLYLCNNTV